MDAGRLMLLLLRDAQTAPQTLEAVEANFDALVTDRTGTLLPLLMTLAELLPEEPRVPELIARTFAATDEADEAESASARAARLRAAEPTIDDLLRRARLLIATDRAADAEAILAPLAEGAHDNPAFLRLWAQVKHIRGALGDTIEAYERLREILPADGATSVQLGIAHRMAAHPEAARRELERVGPHVLARKQQAGIQIEQATALAQRGDVTGALASLTALDVDAPPEVLRMSRLAQSLVLERASRTREALDVLSEVEADARVLDRRAHLLELEGSLPQALALRHELHALTGVAEHLAHAARLAERIGDRAEAVLLADRFAQAFRQERGELLVSEVIDVAGWHFVTLATLRALVDQREELAAMRTALRGALAGGLTRRNVPTGAQRTSIERRLAVVSALLGERDESADLWRRVVTSEDVRANDLAMFGALQDDAGDAASAHALFLAALSESAVLDTDLLDRVIADDDSEVARLVAVAFESVEKRDQGLEVLRARTRVDPSSAAAWRRLARFERWVGLAEAAARHEAKASALEETRQPSLIGRVLMAAVYDVRGQKYGIVHELWAGRYPAAAGGGGWLDEESVFGRLSPEMIKDVCNVFLGVRAWVSAKFPHKVAEIERHRYFVKVTKDDETSGGHSAGIAVALALASVFLGREVPQDFAITGRLVTDSAHALRLYPVGDVDIKALGAWQRRLKRLLVPSGNRVEIETSALLPAVLRDGFVTYVSDFAEVLGAVFGDDIWES